MQNKDQPNDRALGLLMRSLSLRLDPAWIVLGAAVVGLVTAAGGWLTVVYLAAAIAAVGKLRRPVIAYHLQLYGAAFLAVAGFLLTPVGYWFFPFAEEPTRSTVAWLNAGVAVAILVWLAGVWYGTRPLPWRRLLPPWPEIGILIGLVVVLQGPLLYTELSYGGDEFYHFAAVEMMREMLYALIAAPSSRWLLAAGLIIGAASTGAALWRRRSSRYIVWIGLVALVAAAATAAPFYYRLGILQAAFNAGRAARFPAGQPWLSAVIAALLREGRTAFARFGLSNAAYRVLPVIFVYLGGIFLLMDRRRRQSPRLALLAVAALLTAPCLLYFGTILYLDQAVAVLTLGLLLDGERLLTVPASRLVRRPAWWALIALGFMKESALPILLIALGCRGLVQLRQWLRAESRDGRTLVFGLLGELRLGLVCLLPLLGYLVIRQQQGARPYGGEFANLLSPAVWWEALWPLAPQYGLLLAAAGGGAVVLIRQRRYAAFLLAGAMFFGLKVFFIVDSDQYLQLARFNLYLLAPLCYLAWEGFIRLQRYPRRVAAGCTIIIAVNLALAPVTLTGQHRYWRYAPAQRWYPYTDCLRLLQQSPAPPQRVLLANLPFELGLTPVVRQLEWSPPPTFHQVRPGPYRGVEAVAFAINHADRNDYDAVVYRYDGAPPTTPQRLGDYLLIHVFDTPDGGLLLYRRQ